MRVITTERKIKRCRVRVTQNLHERLNFGHYKWVIENSNGDILAAGSSSGGVPNELTEKDIKEIFERWRKDK
mgnify:CR=1 FL=1